MLKNKGFTFIEIMIVIVILAIIAAIAIPKLEFVRNKRPMNPLDHRHTLKQVNRDVNFNSNDKVEINELEPGVYEIWLKDVNKYIKISIEEAGG
jgi:prepilin-type N-terminal cleavage/methylation domain-containing protein